MGRTTKYNNLTTPELISQINPENKQLVSDFLSYLRSVQRSEGTINGYKSDLDIFFVWVLNNLDNKNFVDISKRELVRFQNWLVDDNENSAARIRRIKSAISSMSNYIENVLDTEEGFEGFRSSIRKIESPPLNPVREKVVWTEEELKNLLDTLVESEQYDKACYVALAMYSGRRKAELARFKVSDFNDDHLVCDNALYKSDPILTKGNRLLPCYTLAKKFKPYLDLWVDYRNKNGIESEWLFFDKEDPSKQINLSTFNSWANSFSNITNKPFYPHSLRHFHCSELLRAGIPDGVVVDIFGWKSADMVNVYSDIDKDEKISMYFKDGDIYVDGKKDISEL